MMDNDRGYLLYKKLRMQGESHESASSYENMFVAKEWLERYITETHDYSFDQEDQEDRHPGVPSDW